MSLALVRKEVREHGWVFAAVVLVNGLILAVQLSTAGDSGGRFSALTRFTAALCLSALVASNRLFAREYGGKTQLFLEALPISRARVLATKWLLGAAFQCGQLLAAWAVTLQYMRRTEVITLDDAGRALLATEAFTLGLWSFSAMAGLLGRYRYIAWMVLGFFFALLDEFSVKPAESPLLRLLTETTAMARTPVPGAALGQVLIMVALCVLITAALGLTGSGAMAAALARRMTGRERAFVIAATLVAVFVVVKLKKDHELPPFDLASATRSTTGRGVVGVMKTEEVSEAQARALGEAVSGDVDSLADGLHLEQRPSIFLLPQRGLEPATTQRASLSGTKGIVVRSAPDTEPSMVRARVLHELLKDATGSRGLKEDRHALLDGLAVWWTVRGEPEMRERWWRRAAHAGVPLSRASVTRWGETTERTGDCLGNALAFALVDSLAQKLGPEGMSALAAQLFVAPRDGVLAPLFEEKPEALLRAAGTDWDALTADAERRRAAFREGHAGEWTGEPAAARLEILGDVVKVHVSGVERWRVFYGRLGPWARAQSSLPRLDVRGEGVTLPVTLARGERLLVLVDRDDALLGCPVRLEAQRLESP